MEMSAQKTETAVYREENFFLWSQIYLINSIGKEAQQISIIQIQPDTNYKKRKYPPSFASEVSISHLLFGM